MGFGIRESGSGVSHPYRECSNSGTCDRSTGICKCRDGYSGSACQRKGCISSSSDTKVCNGNGICVKGKYIIEAVKDTSISDDWLLDKYYKCVCYDKWTGEFCDKRKCEYGYDPTIYTTDFIFSYTLLGKGDTVSHYYVFTYNGVSYTSTTVAPYTGICINAGELDIETSHLFRDEIQKKLKVFPYFNSINVGLKCTDGDINKDSYTVGKHLTVTLRLDFMNIAKIKDMEFKVYQPDGTTTAIKDGVDDKGVLTTTSSNALWLMRNSKIIGNEITCYSNSNYIKSDVKQGILIKSPIDLSILCPVGSGQNYVGSDVWKNVDGQTECSSKGSCDVTNGKCNCNTNYYGTACSTKANA